MKMMSEKADAESAKLAAEEADDLEDEDGEEDGEEEEAHDDDTDSSLVFTSIEPFDAHCCHMGTTIKHPVQDRVKPSFVIFDIRAL